MMRKKRKNELQNLVHVCLSDAKTVPLALKNEGPLKFEKNILWQNTKDISVYWYYSGSALVFASFSFNLMSDNC
jgi:hypothetical protein